MTEDIQNAEVGAEHAPEVTFPASLSQERFWILDQLEPLNPALSIALRWRLRGPLDQATLEQAIQAVISRHEILRTSFFEQDGRPVQRVAPAVSFRLSVIDLTRLPESDRAAEALRIGRDDARVPFDLSVPRLLRASLMRMSAEESILLIAVHHIVFDGWSIGVLARDIGKTYEAMRRHEAPALPGLALQYGDYARWQQAWLASGVLADDREYWAHRLAGAKYFEMPTDRVRPPVQTSNGDIASILLPREKTDRVDAFGRHRGATFFMTALAALVAVLHRYAGETDISLGTQIAGRDEVELEDLIGPFINTLVLRVDASGDPTGVELLERAKRAVSEALAHRAMPFEKLIELLRPPRDLSRSPLFSVNIIFQRAFARDETYGEIALEGLPSHATGALYDLNFVMVERAEGWRMSCEYNTDLFDAATVQAVLRCWQTAICELDGHADVKLSRFRLLDADAQQQIAGWNATSAPYPADITVSELFEAQAKRSPSAIAVICGDQKMTYRELDLASNRLAHHLQTCGLGVGSLVGVCLPRAIDMAVAVLGVLKAGAAYVPMDPGYPDQRLSQMVEDSQLALLLLHHDALARVPSWTQSRTIPTLALDVPDAIATQSDSSPGPAAGPDDTAYVIFTSGSTGRPKGVVVPHRALVNLLWSTKTLPGLAEADTLVAVTTLSFDIAALEIFLPLLVGARLVIAQKDETIDGVALRDLLHQSGATVMQATPITWQMLVEADWDGQLKMLCGGEALGRKLADQLLARGGPLWNMYGPTEATVWCAAGQVHEGTGPVAIGPPIANTQLHVLNEALEPMPIGARGELYVGGDGVASGYLGRPDLTRERFLPDPFRNDPGARIYRTGDIVRRRHDGLIEFLGRADHQVKVRGFRIELGEVESALLRHAAVTAAVAAVRSDATQQGVLHAYVVPSPDWQGRHDVLLQELRRDIEHMLPTHMVPSRIMVVASLPRTANGKIDRSALPEPAQAVPAPMEANLSEAPPEDTIAELTAIWRQVLNLPDISPDANFFEIGGHSLLAARMLFAVAGRFGKKIKLASMFRGPTIRHLARALAAEERITEDFEMQTLQPRGQGPAVIAINNFGVFHPLANRLGQSQPFKSIYLADPDRGRPLSAQNLEAIASECIRVLSRSGRPSPCILLGWCLSGNIAFEVAQQLRAAGHEVRLLIMIDTWAPGYRRRLPAWRSFLAGMSYRVKWHLTEWRSGRRTAMQLLLSSRYARKLAQLQVAGAELGEQAGLLDDPYRWFIEYLTKCSAKYEPQRYDGPVLLLRSAAEPSGLFLDRQFGWTGLLTNVVDVAEIPGSHLSVFQAPGVDVMAERIMAALRASDDRKGADEVSSSAAA